MRPYQFKLEAVRRVRQSHRDELRGKLAEAYLAAQKLADEGARIETEIAQMIQSQQQMSRESPLPLDRLMQSQRYEQLLRTQLIDLRQKVTLVDEEIDRRRSAVVAAEQGVKAMDKLEDRGRERHQVELLRVEQKQMDEIAGVMAARKQSFRR